MNEPCRMLMTLSTPHTSEKPDGDAGVEPAQDESVCSDLQIDHELSAVGFVRPAGRLRGRRAAAQAEITSA